MSVGVLPLSRESTVMVRPLRSPPNVVRHFGFTCSDSRTHGFIDIDITELLCVIHIHAAICRVVKCRFIIPGYAVLVPGVIIGWVEENRNSRAVSGITVINTDFILEGDSWIISDVGGLCRDFELH